MIIKHGRHIFGEIHEVRKGLWASISCTMYQRKVDVDTLNTVKSMLADVSSVSPSSEQTSGAHARNVITVFSISTSTLG